MGVWEWLAVASSGLFAGGALFVTVAEHPGRMAAGAEVALAEFGPSYVRAAPWQAGLAAVALVAGLSWGGGAVVGVAFMAGVLVLSVAVLLKPSHALVTGQVRGGEGMRMLRWWGWFHALRSLLGLAGFLGFLAAL